MNLHETLEEYKNKNMYPFHMPGHKRMLLGNDTYAIDMTEVEGVDDLHDPTGPILEEQERIAKIYGADESYILIGGSTVGNLSAIYAALNEGDKIIIPRNAHKSIYNGATIRHLRVEYIWPQLDEYGIYNAVSTNDVVNVLDCNPDAKALILVSPTYEGYHSPIKEIAEICHNRNVILIVDQAHGAHLGYNDHFKNGAAAYADITIQSLHKTLPALTQTAILHLSGKMVDKGRIREALDIFETSSPSYVLMNSVSECMNIMEDSRGLFEKYVDNLDKFYDKCAKLKHLKLISKSINEKDPGKLVISTKSTNISGVELARILREEFQIETEMASFYYVIGITSIMDTKEGFENLWKALNQIDARLNEGQSIGIDIGIKTNKKMDLWEAKAGAEIKLDLKAAINRVSATMACIYPPGSPIVVPGEIISSEVIDLVQEAKSAGLHVTGIDKEGISIVN